KALPRWTDEPRVVPPPQSNGGCTVVVTAGVAGPRGTAKLTAGALPRNGAAETGWATNPTGVMPSGPGQWARLRSRCRGGACTRRSGTRTGRRKEMGWSFGARTPWTATTPARRRTGERTPRQGNGADGGRHSWRDVPRGRWSLGDGGWETAAVAGPA